MSVNADIIVLINVLRIVTPYEFFFKPGLTQLDFRYFQFSFISTIIKIQLFSYFKKYE